MRKGCCQLLSGVGARGRQQVLPATSRELAYEVGRDTSMSAERPWVVDLADLTHWGGAG